MSSRYPRWVEVTRRRTRLSVAVRLVDARTGEELSGDVSIADIDVAPTRHHTGHYLFLDLPSEVPWTVVPEIAGYRTDPVLFRIPPAPFVRETGAIEVPSSLPATRPVVELGLYEADTTLVHGNVTEDDVPVTGTTVSVSGIDLETETDGRGSFVLVFEEGDGVEVAEVAGQRRIQIAGQNPELVATVDPDDPVAATIRRRIAVPFGDTTVAQFEFD